MPTLVRPQIPRTSLQNEYIPITMFNAPWVWDPPVDLPSTFDACTENTLNRGEIDFSTANPDTVQLTEDREFNLSRKLRMDEAGVGMLGSLPTALTFPTRLGPLTMSSGNCPKMPQKLTTNLFATLHGLTDTGPFVDYKSMLTQVAAHEEIGEIPAPLTVASYEAVHTLPAALCADAPSFDAMDYIAYLCHKGLAKEQPKLKPMGSRRMDFREDGGSPQRPCRGSSVGRSSAGSVSRSSAGSAGKSRSLGRTSGRSSAGRASGRSSAGQ